MLWRVILSFPVTKWFNLADVPSSNGVGQHNVTHNPSLFTLSYLQERQPCHKLYGFLIEDGQNQIRAIINKHVDKAVKERISADSSGEGVGGGDDAGADSADTDREAAEAAEGGSDEEDDEAYPGM